MTQVFVSYAVNDRDAALPIVEALNQVGLNVWSDHSILQGGTFDEQIKDVIASAKCVIVLWSEAAAKSEWVQYEIRMAIQAWSGNRLLLATLDNAPLPVGLRDVSAVPIRDEDGAGTKQLIERTKAIVHDGGNHMVAARRNGPVARENRPSAARSGRVRPIIAALAGVSVIFLMAILFYLAGLSPRTSGVPSPGSGWARRFPRPLDGATEPSFLFILMLLVLGAAIGAAIWAWIAWSRWRSNRGPPKAPWQVPASSKGAPQVFISYSYRDEREVEQLVQQIEQMGYAVYIDRQSIGAQRYAGSIVMAIRTSRIIALMCSRNAFASDHVIREIYVAGDYKKPFIAFQLDATEFPDEVLYFLSGFPRIPIATIDAQRLRSEIARLLAA